MTRPAPTASGIMWQNNKAVQLLTERKNDEAAKTLRHTMMDLISVLQNEESPAGDTDDGRRNETSKSLNHTQVTVELLPHASSQCGTSGISNEFEMFSHAFGFSEDPGCEPSFDCHEQWSLVSMIILYNLGLTTQRLSFQNADGRHLHTALGIYAKALSTATFEPHKVQATETIKKLLVCSIINNMGVIYSQQIKFEKCLAHHKLLASIVASLPISSSAQAKSIYSCFYMTLIFFLPSKRITALAA